MTAHHPTRSDVVLVGVDIAKHRHEVLIAAPGKARRRRLTVPNTRAEFDRLVALLAEYDLRQDSRSLQASANRLAEYLHCGVYSLLSDNQHGRRTRWLTRYTQAPHRQGPRLSRRGRPRTPRLRNPRRDGSTGPWVPESRLRPKTASTDRSLEKFEAIGPELAFRRDVTIEGLAGVIL